MSRNKKTGSASRKQSRRLLFENMESRLLMATSQSSLFDRVEQHLDDAPGVAGAAIVNLTTGENVMINADTEFSTSSTIKAGILYAVLRKIDSDPGVTYDTIIDSGSSFGSNQGEPDNPIPDLQANTDYTITALASTMIANSNNWATNRLIQYLEMDYINEQFADLGLTHTEVGRYMVGSGAPSAHGNSSPGGDYAEGFDNRSTPREFATMLQLIHENDGLLTNTSQQTFWAIMGQDGDLGTNTKGYTNDFFGGVLGGWSSFIDQDNKAGSNDWTGDPGDFEFNDALGDHSNRSEAGRFIFTNTGEVVFYTAFVNFAPTVDGVEDSIQQIGYEIAAEFAEAPATYTPSAAQLDDGRVLTVRGTSLADNIDLVRQPGDIDDVDITVNGEFIASVDFEQDNGTDLVNRVYVYGRGGDDDIDMEALPIAIPTALFGEAGHDNVNAGSAASLVGGAGNDTLVGSNQVDFLTGDSGNDTLSGLGGNDIVNGGYNNDTLSGGDGNDIVIGFSGSDSLQGGTGNDTLNGGSGNDTLNGNDGNDTLYGDVGDDTLTGWNGDDTLWGGADDDTLSGSSGEDVLRGEAGVDLLIGGGDSDTLWGGDDNDQLIGGYQTAAVGFAWDQSGDILDGGAGNDAILGDNGQFLPLTFGATGGDDTIRGGIGNDLIFGQGENDHIQGHAGDDNIYSGDGNDTVFGGTFIALVGQPIALSDGSDFVDSGAGNDAIYGDNWQLGFPPTISFGGAGDTLRGNSGDDVIYGQTGNDDLQGGIGNDTLLAGVGDDIADGNSGDDIVRGDVGHDRVVGSEGSDSLYGDVGNDVVVGGRFFATPNNTPDASDDLVEGGDGNDFLFGDSAYLPLTLATNVGGNDTLRGGDGADIMFGQVGNDLLEGGHDNDNLIGGDGNDMLRGDSGVDVLSGQAGNDFLRGGSGDDSLAGGDGFDIVLGESGNDALSGGVGRDLLIGGWGRDNISGQGDEDLLIGGRTSHDANDIALRAILAEWNSARNYNQRVLNLHGTPNGQFANRLNGDFFLVSGITEFDDLTPDTLTGGAANDWFFAGIGDVSDAAGGEQVD